METAQRGRNVIISDQPKLHPSLRIGVSDRSDGTVLDRSRAIHAAEIIATRERVCDEAGLDYAQSVFQRIIYSPDATYQLLADVDERSTTQYTPEIVADGLITATDGVGLFLPVADCVATVVFDPVHKLLALLHLGRHSTLTQLLPQTIARFVTHGSNPADLLVWMSPSVQKQSYHLEYFNHADDPEWRDFVVKSSDGYQLDMQGFNRARCLAAGMVAENIHVSSIDTVTDTRYFSHSAGDTYGRFAVMAVMV